MSKKEITQTFPLIKEQVICPGELRKHLTDTLQNYLAALQTTELNFLKRTIYRPTEGGIWCGEIDFPFYKNFAPKNNKFISAFKGTSDFFDYIWENGLLSYTLTGPDPQRSSWESCVLQDVLYPLFLKL